MKARIKRQEVRRLLGYRLSEPYRTAVSAAAESFGAEAVFTDDAVTPVCSLLGDGEAAAEGEKGDNAAPSEECLLIAGFDRQPLSDLVDLLRETGVRIPLKAVYTPHNREWSFTQLVAELKKEHEYMTGGAKK